MVAELDMGFKWAIRMCLAGELLREHMTVGELSTYMNSSCVRTLYSLRADVSAQAQNQGAHMHKNTHICMDIYAGKDTCTHSLSLHPDLLLQLSCAVGAAKPVTM